MRKELGLTSRRISGTPTPSRAQAGTRSQRQDTACLSRTAFCVSPAIPVNTAFAADNELVNSSGNWIRGAELIEIPGTGWSAASSLRTKVAFALG
jgi:hypothetical protein